MEPAWPRAAELTVLPNRAMDVCARGAIHIQTKFLRLRKPVVVGDRIDDWRVCWLGGWDKCRVFLRRYGGAGRPCDPNFLEPDLWTMMMVEIERQTAHSR